MQKEDCFYLGKVVSKYSFKGEVLVKIDTDEPEIYENMESVFVSIGNNLVPFFIDRCRLHKSTLLRIDFEEVKDEASADRIMGLDKVHGDIGVIKAVNDSSSQVLFEAKKGDKELLIPVTDQIITKVDREAKTIYVTTPEGLVDLYLN